MEKILYIHGYNSTPNSNTFNLLRNNLDKSKYELQAIDYDAEDPEGAIRRIRKYALDNKIDLVIGSSLGGFITLHLYGMSRIAINPCWDPAVELPKIGYTGPTEPYARLLKELKESSDEEEAGLCSGCFAEDDELLGTKYRDIFSRYYLRVYAIPGGHRVSEEAAALLATEIIPDHDAETNDFVYKLINADNLPWLDEL
jgi:predicted esterase YcpF (UPF0227 family)